MNATNRKGNQHGDMTENSINDATTMSPGGMGDVLGRIDQYELVKELGGGGFGTVFLAKDTVAGIEVAVKGLPPLVKNNREELENIRANFALVSRLTHTNIAKALVLHPAKDVSYFSEDVRQKLRVLPGDTLMVMEYAPGVTLSQWRKRFPTGNVPFGGAISIVRQIASALDYAHGQKILHRDIKPANIMVETKADEVPMVRVLDFGLAAEIRSSMGRVSREIHDTSGTRPYMAPEQWDGARQGPATDQYSLAVLFHELVTGAVPFESVFTAGEPVAMLYAAVHKPFKAPASLPMTVRRALEKALSKKPEERFANCGEFVDALDGRPLSKRLFGAIMKGILSAALFAALVGGAWWWMTKVTEPPVVTGPIETLETLVTTNTIETIKPSETNDAIATTESSVITNTIETGKLSVTIEPHVTLSPPDGITTSPSHVSLVPSATTDKSRRKADEAKEYALEAKKIVEKAGVPECGRLADAWFTVTNLMAEAAEKYKSKEYSKAAADYRKAGDQLNEIFKKTQTGGVE